jgi:hypothetical protein
MINCMSLGPMLEIPPSNITRSSDDNMINGVEATPSTTPASTRTTPIGWLPTPGGLIDLVSNPNRVLHQALHAVSEGPPM